MMRILEELGRLLARVSGKRRKGDTDDRELETVVFGLQRLFELEANQIFLLTPEQQFERLSEDEFVDFARDKVLMYAALSAEAGHIYSRQGNWAMARATFTNALRFVLKARARFSTEGWPDYAPYVEDLTDLLATEPLDDVTAGLLKADRAATGEGSIPSG